MTRKEMQVLQPGDIVCHKCSSEAMVITGNYGSYIIAVRQAHITNPDEWDVVGVERELQERFRGAVAVLELLCQGTPISLDGILRQPGLSIKAMKEVLLCLCEEGKADPEGVDGELAEWVQNQLISRCRPPPTSPPALPP